MKAGSGSRDKSQLQACKHHTFNKVSKRPARERKGEAKLQPLGHKQVTDGEKEGVGFKDEAPGPLGLARAGRKASTERWEGKAFLG